MSTFCGRKYAHELTVYGYIRINYTSNEIPEELVHLCFLMYFINIDVWNPAKSFDLSNENRIAHFNYDIGERGWKPIFGSIFVAKGEVQTWKLKRYERDDATMHYGIIVVIDINSREDSNSFFALSPGGYA